MKNASFTAFYRDLPAWFWLGLPIVLYLGHFAARLVGEAFYETWMHGEFGVTEMVTLAILASSIVIAGLCLPMARRLGHGLLTAWLIVFLLGVIYFCGEEASWGQHIMGWEASAEWAALNDQNETNLHNTDGIVGSLLDQLPRTLLTFGALIGGFLLPLIRRLRDRPLDADGPWYWIMPTGVCMAIGLIAPLASVPGKIAESMLGEAPMPLDISQGEIKELLLALFILIYALSLWLRLRQHTAGGA
ncbi:MAG: hypothetical protein CMN28_08940 [Salinisphaeraceae bacterium]|jgi:hypothetical protein|nr:hypothetical protein [Salinisphaeraceae bacterium]